MMKIAIFHYNPVELFPPVMNLVNYLAEEDENNCSIRVYTSHAGKKFKVFEPASNRNVRIYRLGSDTSQKNPLIRFVIYLWHYLFSFVNCLFWRPSKLIYIESLSAPVPVILKKYIFRNSSLFVHYHEYMSPSEYRRTLFLFLMHKLEIGIYKKADWVSHTNEDRMKLFLNDLGVEHNDIPVHIMPNFPSRSWAKKETKDKWLGISPLKLVYAGAIDMNTMYFPEFIDWVETQGGECTLDILSNQDTQVIEDYIRERNLRYTSIKNSVPYFDLPSVLKHYDVGVILYKADLINFLYNAPNKLFEYLGVGLDVWFPYNLEGIVPYIRTEKHPMVLPVNFMDLQKVTIQNMYSEKSEQFEPIEYYAENVYVHLKNHLNSN